MATPMSPFHDEIGDPGEGCGEFGAELRPFRHVTPVNLVAGPGIRQAASSV